MFNNLSGNIEAHQEELQQLLETIEIEERSVGNEISIVVSGKGIIKNIGIQQELLDEKDKDKVEDLLLVTLNNALEKAKKKEMEESQKMIQSMLPSGLGGLSNIFGK